MNEWMNDRMNEWMREWNLVGAYLLLYLGPEISKLSCHAGVKINHGWLLPVIKYLEKGRLTKFQTVACRIHSTL